MKFQYDKEADAAYIYLKDRIAAGEVKKTVARGKNIILDFDKNNKLIGIEVLDASKLISKNVISKAVSA
ncbi:DUF2283 domain-containing protein [Candidatus Woesearchaeota archaeon]|nr:DUF2283 domain-containing protein [Candidatus Woesearchaeota archaeon]